MKHAVLFTVLFHACSGWCASGRQSSTRAVAKQTPEISPYAYCAADPVNFIDPTGMTIEYGDSVTDEQRKRMDNHNGTLSQSGLFTLIYNFLASDFIGIITINFGDIEGSGQFANGNIIYDTDHFSQAAYIEELIHAFQAVFGQMNDPSINKEYEARMITETILGEVDESLYSVNFPNDKFPELLDYFIGLHEDLYLVKRGFSLRSESYKQEYQKYGKMFVDYYKDKYSDDSSYHVPTTAPSRLFVYLFGCYKIINFLMNTFK